jgi:hypothetical protein
MSEAQLRKVMVHRLVSSVDQHAFHKDDKQLTLTTKQMLNTPTAGDAAVTKNQAILLLQWRLPNMLP